MPFYPAIKVVPPIFRRHAIEFVPRSSGTLRSLHQYHFKNGNADKNGNVF